MSKKIWVLRWVFDPVHEGHHSNMMFSLSGLKLDLLNVITKFLWEKDRFNFQMCWQNNRKQ